MKMKKFMQIMALMLVVFSVLSLTACKKYHMSEEEIKEACISEAEYFVGGYLRNDGPDFLEKYDPFPEQEYESKKLEDNYTWDLTDLAYRICNKVADYILEGATFETDQTSFDYDKKNDSARLVVDVTILPPEKVFAAIEEYVESVRYLSVDVSEVEAEAEASFQYILSMIDDIQPVTASIPIEFYYNEDDKEWQIKEYWMVMIHINEAE